MCDHAYDAPEEVDEVVFAGDAGGDACDVAIDSLVGRAVEAGGGGGDDREEVGDDDWKLHRG